MNSVRSVMKSMGYRAPSCSTDCFQRKVAEQLPDELKDVLGAVVGMVGELTARIGRYDKMVQRHHWSEPKMHRARAMTCSLTECGSKDGE